MKAGSNILIWTGKTRTQYGANYIASEHNTEEVSLTIATLSANNVKFSSSTVSKNDKNLFQLYLNREQPFLPTTSLFDRGEMIYNPLVSVRHREDRLFRNYLFRCALRHLAGDWGDICEVDRQTNNNTLQTMSDTGVLCSPLVSFYQHPLDEDLSLYFITDQGCTLVSFADGI